MDSPFDSFCSAVCSQIRALNAWDAITAELTAHLADHAEALEHQGATPGEAARQAMEAMGDPAELGRALNKCHSPWPWWVARFCITLMGIALILFFFVGLSWLESHGGMTPLFRSMSLSQAQQQLGNPAFSIVDTCPVSGAGRVGDYYLHAVGDALLCTNPDYPDEGLIVTFLISERHLQPWLGAMDYPWYALSAVDDLGNRYPWGNILLYSPDKALLSSWQEAAVVGIDPEASRLTLVLDPGKGSASFTVQLREEAAP